MYGNEEGYGQRRSYAPVQVGDEIEVQIEAVGEKGDGIAKKDGFVLFIPNTKQGDNVKVRVSRVLRKVGFAEVIGQQSAPVTASENAEPEPEDTEDFGEESTDQHEVEEESQADSEESSQDEPGYQEDESGSQDDENTDSDEPQEEDENSESKQE